MATTTDAPVQNQTDNSEAQQLGNQKHQTLIQNVQEAVSQAADPKAWNSQPLDMSVSDVATSGKDSLFQDQSVPSGMNTLAASDNSTAGSSDPMHQYMNDLSSVLNASSSLLGDIGNLTSSMGANPTADQQQL